MHKKKSVILSIGILLVIFICGAFLFQHFFAQSSKTRKAITIQKNTHMDQEKKINPNNNNVSGKFSDSEYAPICWQIAPTQDLNQEAHTALFGMVMKKQNNTDGSVTVNLKPNSPDYKWNQFIVKKGYKLYFCDYTDDDEEVGMSDTDFNSNGDDFPLMVDPQGNIVPGQPLPDVHNQGS